MHQTDDDEEFARGESILLVITIVAVLLAMASAVASVYQ